MNKKATCIYNKQALHISQYKCCYVDLCRDFFRDEMLPLLTNCRNTEWAFTTYNSNTTNGWVTYTVRTCRRWAPAVNARTSDKVSVAGRRPCLYSGLGWEDMPGSLVPASDNRRTHTPRSPSPPRILQVPVGKLWKINLLII